VTRNIALSLPDRDEVMASLLMQGAKLHLRKLAASLARVRKSLTIGAPKSY